MRAETLRALVLTLGAGLALAGCGQKAGGEAKAASAAPASTTAQGPSFDCKAAKTALEHAVCADPELAAADREMSEAYKHLSAALPEASRKALARAQSSFVAYVAVDCAGAGGAISSYCVRNAYELQTVGLDGAIRKDAEGRRFLTLTSYQIWPGGEEGERRPERISTSTQALSDDARLTSWNSMIAGRLAAWEKANGGDPRKDGGYDAAATVFGSTADFIETQVEVNFTPQVGLSQRSHWSLKLGRELTAADLFKDPKAGVEALARLAAEDLGAEDPAELAGEIADPAGWGLEPDGIFVLPQEPKGSGATVSWAALKPYLRPDLPFDPAKLVLPERLEPLRASTGPAAPLNEHEKALVKAMKG